MKGLYDAIVCGSAGRAVDFVKDALKAGADPRDLVRQAIEPAAIHARDFHVEYKCIDDENMFALDHVRILHAVTWVSRTLRLEIARMGIKSAGRIVISSLDYHTLGKEVVALMLECNGFEVVDQGAGRAPYILEAQRKSGTILAISCALNSLRAEMKRIITDLEKSGVRDITKVMVGGNWVTQAVADEIGADGYAENAWDAAHLAKNLVRQS